MRGEGKAREKHLQVTHAHARAHSVYDNKDRAEIMDDL